MLRGRLICIKDMFIGKEEINSPMNTYLRILTNQNHEKRT